MVWLFRLFTFWRRKELQFSPGDIVVSKLWPNGRRMIILKRRSRLDTYDWDLRSTDGKYYVGYDCEFELASDLDPLEVEDEKKGVGDDVKVTLKVVKDPTKKLKKLSVKQMLDNAKSLSADPPLPQPNLITAHKPDRVTYSNGNAMKHILVVALLFVSGCWKPPLNFQPGDQVQHKLPSENRYIILERADSYNGDRSGDWIARGSNGEISNLYEIEIELVHPKKRVVDR